MPLNLGSSRFRTKTMFCGHHLKIRFSCKLDGVAPLITDPSQTSSTTFSSTMQPQDKILNGIRAVIPGHDLECDKAVVTWRRFRRGQGGYNPFKLGKGWISQFMNDKGFCRTAPATPGLLMMFTERLLRPPDFCISQTLSIWLEIEFTSIFFLNISLRWLIIRSSWEKSKI